MRPIRFRAWDKIQKEMHEVRDLNIRQALVAIGKPEYLERFGNVELLQFTGLKDKNGKEIYEGDIVRGLVYQLSKKRIGEAERTGDNIVGKIEWDIALTASFGIREWTSKEGGCFYDLVDDPTATANMSLPADELEVIGNIYEHPELLKNK